MKISMKVKKVNHDYVWEEIYDIDNSKDPQEYAESLVNNFNSTLREGEAARELIGVEIVDSDSEPKLNHKWEKTNLVTLMNRNGSYDAMKCLCCGITGKRYGIGGSVLRDVQYKAKKYDYCN